MQRREFSTALVGAGALALGLPAAAQGGPVEGTHYVRLGQPLPVTAPAGKVEVVEFFWYGCPHCNAFEPALEAWVKKLPEFVAFRRVPVQFREEPFGTHQRIYFALETMGQLEAMHRKVFAAIHNDRLKLDKPAEIQAFMSKNGLDGARFIEVMNSFGVQTKARQAKQLAEAYKIDGVPALGIQGRFYTSGSLAGGQDKMLVVADFLIQASRKG
ncbi:MAG TPA: thiol:disulfide interchange protein DsbA/DsbL [Piscinibacter sp.]|uniref:thiol:disulfide interchange protein DsbA/DsbL n=1 Tax=Piscinibacter sp. TaxID=1903157 RepID=UPI0011D58ED7|nr:thiol:disulfide interchange protein DsbA/DsbL [Piscinibacter sp.]MBP5990249.1 thiol:disulfide interchange protein DsbA/DsbL [Piscinibacter sp.]MBP6027641.1 thiol:disulfide interchange protein DsbA/DsbL [Piscinibacter sp.]TXH48335.1 MAG: thiol:disulfide interchange protein DsbA/DsbL [Burkholderiaceae bacterium]HNK20318.1 thiol:disulfide interchange protein DsbA/DsbL [Piscinibacter sp.]